MFVLFLSALALAPVATTEPLSHDDRGRPTIRVRIDEHGPFEMIVDTAAQTSLIVPGVADELGLKPLEGEIGVAGATGQATAALYPIDRFASNLFDARDVAMVALPNIGMTSARGIVGMDNFTGRKLLFDRAAASLGALPSSPAAAGYATLKGRTNEEGFVTVPLSLNGTRIDAVVDTGAAVTVGNAAVLRALGWGDGDPRLTAGGTMRGAAGSGSQVRTARIDRLSIGPATLSGMTLIISDRSADDGDTPHILLGSDILNRLDAYAVDFGRGELQIRVPAKP